MPDDRLSVRVDPAVPEREWCLVPERLRRRRGLAVGQQVRLRSGDGPALFTVRDPPDDRDTPAVNPAGRDRTGASGDSFPAELDARVVHPDLDYEAAMEAGEFVERASVGDDTLVALAPHGGHVEAGTDAQVRRLADRGASAWYCAGWWPGGGAFDRWHVTSNATDPGSFPALGRLRERSFGRAVSFHGWTREGVGIGGGADRRVRERVRDAVDRVVDVDVYLVTDENYRGDNPANVVNWLGERGGVQLEQGLDVRTERWEAIADAVDEALR
jgi:phage replication-related protein YjqB (UPF0714/DUF867 family)